MDSPMGEGAGAGVGHKQQQERPHGSTELPSWKGEQSTESAQAPSCNNLGIQPLAKGTRAAVEPTPPSGCRNRGFPLLSVKTFHRNPGSIGSRGGGWKWLSVARVLMEW